LKKEYGGKPASGNLVVDVPLGFVNPKVAYTARKDCH